MVDLGETRVDRLVILWKVVQQIGARVLNFIQQILQVSIDHGSPSAL